MNQTPIDTLRSNTVSSSAFIIGAAICLLIATALIARGQTVEPNGRGLSRSEFAFDLDRYEFGSFAGDFADRILSHYGRSHALEAGHHSHRHHDISLPDYVTESARHTGLGVYSQFDAKLFGSVAQLASPVAAPKIYNSASADGGMSPQIYYMGSGGNWAVAWGGPGAIANPAAPFPDGQGDTATDLQEVSGSVVQNIATGVTVGVIDHHPTSAGNSAHNVAWTITTDNVINMDNGAAAAQILNSQQTGSNTLTIDGAAGLNLISNLDISNADPTGLITISAPIAGTGKNVTVTGDATGLARTVFTGNNTYSGTTSVSSGVLEAGAAHSLGGTSGITVNTSGTLLFSGNTTDRIKDTATFNLNGGTLNTAGLSEGAASTPGIGALTLTSASTIDLGSLTSILAFADSHTQTWAGTLRITNWSGSSTGDGADQVYFGSTSSGLSASQLSKITFYSDSAGTMLLGTATILPDGEVVPVPVPEPSTWAAGALAFAFVGYTQRRRLLAKLSARKA
jgi:autotransporter-associated beta strand protein